MSGRGPIQARLDEVLDLLGKPEARTRFGGWRYSENGQVLPVGEGMWATADRVGPYCHTFIDPDSGEAACFATLTEGGTRSMLALRVSDGEIEALVARPALFGGGGAFGDGAAALDGSDLDPRWLEPIHASERETREELVRVADAYFTGLENNDGLGDYPFADDCIRIENGFRTTGVPAASDAGKTPYLEAFRSLSARQQFETGYFRFVDRIRDRRYPVVDRERGLVFAFAFFDHSGRVREYQLADGTPRRGVDRPFSWMIAEGFRVEHGLLTRIEALMTEVPYGMKAGWPA